MLFSDQKGQPWKHGFWILLLFTQFLIYWVLVYAFKYVNSIEHTYTVFTKNGECSYEKLFTYILLRSDKSAAGEIFKFSVLVLFDFYYCIFSEFSCLLPFSSLDPVSAPPCHWNVFFLSLFWATHYFMYFPLSPSFSVYCMMDSLWKAFCAIVCWLKLHFT